MAFADFDMAPPEPVAGDRSSGELSKEKADVEALVADELAMPMAAAAPMAAPAAEVEEKLAEVPMFAAMDAPAGPPVINEPMPMRKLEEAGFDDFRGGNARLDLAERQQALGRREMKPEGRLRARMNLKDAIASRPSRADEDEYLGQFRFAVREYSHEHVAGEPGVRSDFAETLYWNPMLVTDADGQAQIHFDLSDSVTTFRVMADAHADGGRIGSGDGELISRIPFSLEPKLPLEVTAGDRIDLPLAVVNDTASELPVEARPGARRPRAAGRHGEADAEARGPTAGRGSTSRWTWSARKATASWPSAARPARWATRCDKSLSVVPPGFPKELSYSGQLDGEQEVVVELPENVGARLAGGRAQRLPLHALRSPAGHGQHPAASRRLLRAGLDVQLPQRALAGLHAGARRGRPGRHPPGEGPAGQGLRQADRLRVPASTATSGSAATRATRP